MKKTINRGYIKLLILFSLSSSSLVLANDAELTTEKKTVMSPAPAGPYRSQSADMNELKKMSAEKEQLLIQQSEQHKTMRAKNNKSTQSTAQQNQIHPMQTPLWENSVAAQPQQDLRPLQQHAPAWATNPPPQWVTNTPAHPRQWVQRPPQAMQQHVPEWVNHHPAAPPWTKSIPAHPQQWAQRPPQLMHKVPEWVKNPPVLPPWSNNAMTHPQWAQRPPNPIHQVPAWVNSQPVPPPSANNAPVQPQWGQRPPQSQQQVPEWVNNQAYRLNPPPWFNYSHPTPGFQQQFNGYGNPEQR